MIVSVVPLILVVCRIVWSPLHFGTVAALKGDDRALARRGGNWRWGMREIRWIRSKGRDGHVLPLEKPVSSLLMTSCCIYDA